MSTQYSAKIIVGLHRDDMDGVDEDIIEGMDQCPPYYDGGDEAVIGYEAHSSGCYSARELAFDQSEIDKLKAQFKEETGLDAKVWLSSCGY